MAFQHFKEQLDRDISRSEMFFEKLVSKDNCEELRTELDLHKRYISGVKRLASDLEGFNDMTPLLVAAKNMFEGRKIGTVATFFRNQGAVAAAFMFGLCFSGAFFMLSVSGQGQHAWKSSAFEVTVVIDSPSDLEEATIAFDFPEGVLYVGESLNDSVVIDTDLIEGPNEFVLPLKISTENAENELLTFDAIISHGDTLKPFTLSLKRDQFFEVPRV